MALLLNILLPAFFVSVMLVFFVFFISLATEDFDSSEKKVKR
jgi:hypothetical protein